MTHTIRTVLIPTVLIHAAAAMAAAPPAIAAAAPAANSAPQAVPIARSVPDPVDTPYPGGALHLAVDASDVARGLWRIHETIPLPPGPASTLTLLFPEWLPGNHGPRGTLSELVDLRFEADGHPLEWKRDPVEVFAFHVRVPPGARAVNVAMIRTSPLQPSEGRITMTADMLDLQWEKLSLYPAGHYVRQIRVVPEVTLPAGWQAASALDGAVQEGSRVRWAETAYDTLVDSPVYAGRWLRRWDLGSGVRLDAVADSEAALAATEGEIGAHRALVREALAAFGAAHFDHYDLLLALSDKIGGIGLEHHRSSENQMGADALAQWDRFEWERGLLPHEFSHSWSGKYRRPARLWTPDYRQPMQGDLLWAYEGQDQFWGLVLAARSGLQGKAMVLGQLANYAGNYATEPGRGWRSVEDTGSDPVIAARRPKPWPSMARGEDYYTEGALVWLEIDQIIRGGTGGAKGIDDFAKVFFGMRPGDWGELPFEQRDVAAALNTVYPYDWAGFLAARFDEPGQPAPLGGIERGGYALVWKAEPNPYDKARMAANKTLSLTYSLGLTLDRDGKITAVQWDSPAFNAGIVAGARVVAVNGVAYDPDRLRAAITQAATGAPLALLVNRGDRFDSIALPWTGGLRYPWLERRAPGTAPTGLDRLLAPRTPNAG